METNKVLLKHQFVGSARDLPVEYSVDSELKIITIMTNHFDSSLMTFFLTSHIVDLDVLHKNEGCVSTKPEYSIVLLINKVKYALTAHLLPCPPYSKNAISIVLASVDENFL